MKYNWLYDEFQHVGKDYSQQQEVDVYDASHADFRDIDKESQAILDAIDLQDHTSLIEFGCGTGVLAVLAAQRGAQVYAVDISEAMLDYARKRAQRHHLTNITFTQAGFLTYKHSADSVDAMVSSLALHHLPDFWKGVALKRMYAMLKPGGKLVLVDVVVEGRDAIAKIDAFIEKQTQAGGDFLRDDAEGHFREEFSTYTWVMEGLLERAGFKIISMDQHDGVFAKYICEK